MTDKITFNDLGLPEFILKAVSDLGFETPSSPFSFSEYRVSPRSFYHAGLLHSV